MKVLAKTKEMKMWMLLLTALSMATTSCDKILGEDNVDCSTEYRVKFKYDKNMKFADAFANEVKSVTLYAFDENGKFAFQSTEQGDVLSEDGYSMQVEVEPGDYNLVAWGGLEGEESFAVPILKQGVSTINDLNCKMNREHISRAADGSAYVNEDLKPLFHGQLQKQSFSRAATQQVITVELTKNTNNVRIILQHLSGENVDVSKFTFTIEDENGFMNYDNKLLDDEELTYYAWRTDSGTADMDHTDGSRATTSVGVAIAELTVGRLVVENKPVLTITNEKGEKVLSIPLIDYALLVKGYYNREMTDQEYLDRQDEYNMTFFLDENNRWASSSIIINSWKVVLDDVDLK